MSPKLIVVGGKYRNSGAGWTTRTVLAIGEDVEVPQWCQPDKTGLKVRFSSATGKESALSLTSFASWAGSRVDDSPAADLDGAKGADQ